MSSQERARANLGAGPLRSYAFEITTSLGDRPMTYLFARHVDAELIRSRLMVVAPKNLRTTWVDVCETAGAAPAVHLMLPTMRHGPRALHGARQFDCLPLTDVGYLDLMAWPHPEPTPEDEAEPPAWLDGLAGTRLVRRAMSSPCGPGVVEYRDTLTGVAVARSVLVDGIEVHRWTVTELGPAEHDYLPRAITAVRPSSGTSSKFRRTTSPRPIPSEWLDDSPEAFISNVSAELHGVRTPRTA